MYAAESRLTQADTEEAAAERDAVAAGRLPERYGTPWQQPFLDRVAAALAPGARVLDVGSGARPAIAREQRPVGCHYVGLDVSPDELDRAGADAYDERVVAEVELLPHALDGRFDIVLSWQVLEHVASMADALAAQHRALVPGGRMVAMLSGAWGLHSVVARMVPYRLSRPLQARLLGVAEADKFPTRYDHCSHAALIRLLRQGGWSSYDVVPLYKAGGYLRFSGALQQAYLAYENWAARRPRPALATHYVIDAVRA